MDAMRARVLQRVPARCQRGFTLLEILVVIVIIGITLSMAVLSMRPATDDVRQETERLAALLGIAAEEAILQGREMAVEFTGEGYNFLAFDGQQQQWVPLQDEDTLRPRGLPEGMRVDLEIEGEKLFPDTPPPEGEEAKEDSSAGPRLFLLSSGEITPFRLVMRREGEAGPPLVGESQGKITLKEARGNDKS